MNAYYLSLPVMPLLHVAVLMVLALVTGTVLAVVVGLVLGRLRPARYFGAAAAVVLAVTVVLGAGGLYLRHSSAAELTDTRAQTLISSTWPHLGPVTVQGAAVLGPDGDCGWTVLTSSGTRHLMVLCDGRPVPRSDVRHLVEGH